MKYLPVTGVDEGGRHAICLTKYTQIQTEPYTCHELTFRDSEKDPDDPTHLIIKYPSDPKSEGADLDMGARCFYFTTKGCS